MNIICSFRFVGQLAVVTLAVAAAVTVVPLVETARGDRGR
jgi:hypothetical protein